MQITRVLNKQFVPGKNWSNRNKTCSKFKILIHKIRNFLETLSGFDMLSMLQDILSAEERFSLSLKYVHVLKGIAKTVNRRVEVKQKHHFIRPLRLAALTLSNVNELGFECGKQLWKNCLFDHERLPGGRPRLDEKIQNDIENHF